MAVLEKELRSPGAEDLVALARKHFLRSERLEIQTLAEELGVSRATAYRWAGNADLLAGRVIAGMVEDTHRRCVREARGKGWDRIVDVNARGLRYIAASRPYRSFLERDPETALRIVATKEGPVQQRTVALQQELLEEEARRGRIRLPVDAHTLAYAIVRLSESFLYADIIAGEEPDVEKCVELVRLLCR
jgi:AcrR family transcriptional regulator